VLTRLPILAACVLAAAATTQAADPQPKLVNTVYQVADLVVPLPACDHASFWHLETTAKKGKSHTTMEDRLIRQIEHAVQPASWDKNGGRGTLQYFAPTMSLVVSQTPQIQEQIANLLSRLRKNQDIQVALEVRFLSVSQDLLKRTGIEVKDEACPLGSAVRQLNEVADPDQEPKFLTDAERLLLLKGASDDVRTNCMSLPKLTLANHRTSTGTTPHEMGQDIPGFIVKVHPVVSADRRFVKLGLNIQQTDEPLGAVEKVVALPDGGTVLLGGFRKMADVQKEYGLPVVSSIPYVDRLFRCAAPARELRRVFVLVTARVVVPQEVEEKVAAPTVCWKSQEVQGAEPTAKILADLLHAYDTACDEGRGDEADKLARAALILDPACFHRKR